MNCRLKYTYNEVLDKVCNSRFNEVMDNYAEQRALKGKGKLGLRPTLLAGVSAKKEGTAGATITASPSPTFDVLLLGENGAVGTKLLNGSFFVLTGSFNEVNTFKITAEEDIKKMIKSFGGEVKKSFSVNTSKFLCHLISNQLLICSVVLSLEYLLAGKNADTGKIKRALERHVVVINLRRLQKLLLGQLTIEELKQLERLTKDSFKGNAYEAAETLATNTAGATNAIDE